VGVLGALSFRAASRICVPALEFPELDPESWALRDFRDAVYFPGFAVLQGDSPYNRLQYTSSFPVGQDFPPYSPLAIGLHLPFARLPFGTAQVVYFAVTIALTLAFAWCTLFVCGLPRNLANALGLGAVILASRPGHMNLLLGQTTMPLAIAALLGFHWAGSRPWLAGLCLALTTYKPSWGVPLIALACAMGHRRAAATSLAWALILTLPLACWLIGLQGGFDGTLRMIQENNQVLYENPGRDPARSFSRIDALSVGARLLMTTPAPIWELIVLGGALSASGLTLFRAGQTRQPPGGNDPRVVFALLVMLVATYHHAYDAVVAVPIVMLAWIAHGAAWPSVSTPERIGWCGLVAVPLLNYGATNSVLQNWPVSSPAWTGITCVNGLALLIATVWTGGWLIRDRHSPAARHTTEVSGPSIG
jgi:hypothetical protein